MITFTWKILDMDFDGSFVTRVKYFLSANDEANTVETEGYWNIEKTRVVAQLRDLTEDVVIKWLEEDSVQNNSNIIKSRLVEQLNALSNESKTTLPWLPPETFRISL